jgi:hypothetical protein
LVSLAAASEPPFFACAKKEWPKESTPRRLRPALRAGSAGIRGVFRQYIPVLSKNARRPVARPAGLIRESRRNQGPRQIKIKILVD